MLSFHLIWSLESSLLSFSWNDVLAPVMQPTAGVGAQAPATGRVVVDVEVVVVEVVMVVDVVVVVS